MQYSSEYAFPIFISSTEYNLKDLRAELATFLSSLSYKPILSSANGFPDYSPNLEPWESCLPVLAHSFIMILIIDGRYGTPLPWPNFSELFKDRCISPTHGEYIFALTKNIRLLVFIRKELMPYYQIYRNTMKNKDGELLKKNLPGHIDIESLEFINEIKTTRPIPWIMEFENITDLKAQVQKKMLNELADAYHSKGQELDSAIKTLCRIFEGMDPEEQTRHLKKIPAAYALFKKKQELERLGKEFQAKQMELENLGNEKTKEKAKLHKKIDELEQQILALKSQNFPLQNKLIDADIANSSIEPSNVAKEMAAYASSHNYWKDLLIAGINQNRCDRCMEFQTDLDLQKCPACQRKLCIKCWQESYFSDPLKLYSIGLIGSNQAICPDCKNS